MKKTNVSKGSWVRPSLPLLKTDIYRVPLYTQDTEFISKATKDITHLSVHELFPYLPFPNCRSNRSMKKRSPP